MKRVGALAAIVAATLIVGCGPKGPAAVDAKRIERAAAGEWLSYGRTYDEQRFSPLDKVNRENVGTLGLAWYAEFDTDRGQEATPLMVDGVLYTTTAWSKVYAFDAKTGEKKWEFDPKVPGDRGFAACCDVVNRGVAVWEGKVFVGTLDGRLIALDAATGTEKWSVVTVDQAKPYTITMAPRVVQGNVLIGNSGGEYGVRGYLTAYDAATGDKKWRFYMTPNAEGKADGEISDAIFAEKANATWSDGAWKQSGGGGTPWDAIAYDPALNSIFVGVGNGAPWNHRIRSGGVGDNLFLSSILALDATTGAYKWHYQTTPGETWDYTATQHIMLADITVGGKPRKVLMQAPKNGFFYVLDRTTGELISADPYIPMAPEADTPAGVPISWSTGVVGENGRPIENPSARYANGPALISPAPFGAHNWQPMAFNPTEGLVFIPVTTVGALAQVYGDDPNFQYRNGGWNTGISMNLGDLPNDEAQRAALKAMLRGRLVAWDPVARKARWSVELPSFWNAGLLSTAGGLVFQGAAEGQFHAYDAADGKKLWSYDTTNGIIAAPMTYAIDGEQYVVVMVGFGGAGALSAAAFLPDRPRLPGRIMVFKLGGAAQAAAYDIPPRAAIDLAGVSSRASVAQGRSLFNANCLVCHSANASGGYLPDLRRSAMIRAPETFRSVVIDGALQANGMASFSRYLNAGQAEAIRAYLITEARRQQGLDTAAARQQTKK
ncbi:MAG: alcohol dehydrogenase (cytochrome c) [Caulobacteraceae bacterium]|nr:MAG: alcohol dehydrogenase (cytochrome c) [Caulobacteraceae bacterium]